MAFDINPEVAKKLIEADELNLVKKIREGKPLNKYQRETLEEIASKVREEHGLQNPNPPAAYPATALDTGKFKNLPEYAPSLRKLADLVKKNPGTIHKWSKQKGFPAEEAQGWPVQKIAAWIDLKNNPVPDALVPGLNQKKLELDVELKAIDLSLKQIQESLLKEETMLTAKHIEVCEHLIMGINGVVRPLPQKYAPRLMPDQPEVAERLLTEIAEDIMLAVRKVPYMDLTDTATRREKRKRTSVKQRLDIRRAKKQ